LTYQLISVIQLREWLHDGKEIAVLDISEGGQFANAHILIASNIPPAQIEVLLSALVPRQSTRIILTSADATDAPAIAALMATAGYMDIHVLDGGNNAWKSAGFRLFSGSNIVSKAFGEVVEAECETPHIEAEELASWLADDKEFYLFDSRPLTEYRTVSLPRATDCPGGELVYRVSDVVTDPTVPIVVNCAGRTRSIIGAQSLRDAGFPNPIYALKNGTMGWQIAGLAAEKGKSNILPEPNEPGLSVAVERGRLVASRSGIRFVSFVDATNWALDDTRTTYFFDVRQPDVFARGHVPGSVNAPGGQLVQATDIFVAVRHSRIILIDDHLVQSVMSAHWLSRMGWDVWVMEDAASHMTEMGLETKTALRPPRANVGIVGVSELQTMLADHSCEVIDVGESYWYRQGRIPGSWYSKRSDLPMSLQRFSKDGHLVFVCTHGATSPYAAGDALDLGYSRVSVLDGGRTAWRQAKKSIEVIDMDDDDFLLSVTDDMWYPPWSRKEGARESMIEYLTWEVGLMEFVSEETYVSFRL
jgi:rhodanese-related sulfurtransferase